MKEKCKTDTLANNLKRPEPCDIPGSCLQLGKISMKELESIWKKPIYLPYLQPKLTDEILEKAELKLGYKLPKELIELLKIQNGGYIRKMLERPMNEQIYGIGPYFPSITDLDWTEYKDWVSFELEGLIPFDGDGHWYIVLTIEKIKPTRKSHTLILNVIIRK